MTASASKWRHDNYQILLFFLIGYTAVTFFLEFSLNVFPPLATDNIALTSYVMVSGTFTVSQVPSLRLFINEPFKAHWLLYVPPALTH
jgi:hypothetical protein